VASINQFKNTIIGYLLYGYRADTFCHYNGHQCDMPETATSARSILYLVQKLVQILLNITSLTNARTRIHSVSFTRVVVLRVPELVQVIQ